MRFECSGCGRTLEVGAELAGRRVRCPACRIVAFAPAADVPEVQPIDEIEEVEPIRAPHLHRQGPRRDRMAVVAGSILYAAAFHLILLALFAIAWSGFRGQAEATPTNAGPQESGMVLVPLKRKWDPREAMAKDACRERLAAVTRTIDIWKRDHGVWPSTLGDVMRDAPYGSCRAEYEVFEETSEGRTRRLRQVACPEHHMRIEFGFEER